MEKRTLNLREILTNAMLDAFNKNENYIIMKTLMHILENNENIVLNLDLNSSDYIIYKAMIKKMTELSEHNYLDENYDNVSEGTINLIQLHINRIKAGKL